MNPHIPFLSGLTLGLALATGSAQAFFDTPTQKGSGETAYTAQRAFACTLVKTSYKGDNEGFFSDAEKSVEATCHDRDGEPLYFSATMPQWATLRDHAGREIVAYLSNQKLENAKTPWTLIEIHPTDKLSYQIEKLCGPTEGEHLLQAEKVWSRGFRLAQVYDAERLDKGWRLHAYVGFEGDSKWAEDGSLTLGEPCKSSIHPLLKYNGPMIYTYVQEDEDPDYLIEAIYKIKITGGK